VNGTARAKAWLATRHTITQRVLVAAVGVLAALGQAPFDLPWLAVPGLSCLCALVILAPGPRTALWHGLFAGAGHFAVSLHWIVEPFFVDAPRHGWMAPFAIVLISFGMALFWAAAAWLAARLAPAVLARALVWVALLTAGEWLRATILTGFPWAHPGHIWINTPLLPLAAWAGPHGFTLYTLALAAGLACAVLVRPWLALGLPLLHAAVLGLAFSLPPAPAPGPDAAVIRLIQPNAPQHLKWQAKMIPVFFRRNLSLTAAPPEDPAQPPRLVIWPETSLAVLLNHSEEWRTQISQAAGPVPVILGAQRLEGEGARNALVVLTPDGEIQAIQDKHHLVPFGEYIPFADLLSGLGVRGLAAVLQMGYRPGPGPGVLDLGPLGHAFAMICYEAIFPGYIGRVERPDWMVHITNDAWFGRFSGPYQHLAMARLRAAEQGLPVLRAANTGISGVIDARGQLLASLPLGQAGALDVSLPPALPPTVYARMGDGPVWLAILALLLLVAAMRRAKGR